ncbi:MAG TPA: hypothetical protein VN279_09000, partial [Rhodocyclaceae bacterium]|nr:hypothetical protein [Rhodocyclaceae bacterium]
MDGLLDRALLAFAFGTQQGMQDGVDEVQAQLSGEFHLVGPGACFAQFPTARKDSPQRLQTSRLHRPVDFVCIPRGAQVPPGA